MFILWAKNQWKTTDISDWKNSLFVGSNGKTHYSSIGCKKSITYSLVRKLSLILSCVWRFPDSRIPWFHLWIRCNTQMWLYLFDHTIGEMTAIAIAMACVEIANPIAYRLIWWMKSFLQELYSRVWDQIWEFYLKIRVSFEGKLNSIKIWNKWWESLWITSYESKQ